MVKLAKYFLAFGLIAAFAAPAFAQDDYPTFQIAPGYGNISFGIPNAGIPVKRHSGFTMDADYNFKPALGVDVFTGYYSLGNSTQLYSNTFGGIVSLRKSAHVVPFGTAGFGFGYYLTNNGGAKAIATRYGGGVDIPFQDSLGIRVDVTRMTFHFNSAWETGTNISVGILLNLSQ